ncbi:hypothetical protein RED13_000386, partial [Halopseudomonas formosensis]|nr:hypothetical protein [Halopseudomonas formosensis]
MVTHVNNPARPLSQRLAQALDGYPLQADRSTGAALMCMPEVEEHTEHYLAIEHGDSAHRGMLSGALGGMCSFFFGVFAVIFLLDNDLGTALMYFLIAVVCFVPSFLWEILR